MKYKHDLSMEEEIKKAWEFLNSEGIYTLDELEEAYNKCEINISVFVSPLSEEGVEKH